MRQKEQPAIAVIGKNTLFNKGLAALLEEFIPDIKVCQVRSFDDLLPETIHFYHFFVPLSFFIAHHSFFADKSRSTILLCSESEKDEVPRTFRALYIDRPEPELIRQLLTLLQIGHSGGRNFSPQIVRDMYRQAAEASSVLSPREIEVLKLVVQGCLNKEIADRLNICITTVITHRKNIVQKLGIKSVAGLTVYAVTHGLLLPNESGR